MKFVKLLCILTGFSFFSYALKSDYAENIHITADKFYGTNNKEMIYEENVIVKQGTLLIHADKISTLSKRKKEDQIIIATGNPVTYKQLMENQTYITASAKEIHYNVDKHTVLLLKNGQIEQNGNMIKGSKITYDMKHEKLIAEGNNKEQITTIFQPNS